jgi:FkbH-like protein
VQAFGLEQRMRGVILAVCSKNEHDTALRVFREHPDMLLREADIAAFQVNWDDKATNLRRIAESLNIGVDSLVFVDDNPAERDRVRQVLPMVAVPELPDDPAEFAPVLWAASYFEAIALSDEDLKRADTYKANLARVETLSKLGDMEAYLASLEMAAIFAPFNPLGRSRIAQLINKSNQFNLTTRRYTESQVGAIEVDPSRFHLQVRLTDKFGDNGMVSVVIFDKRGKIWECDTWLMSCRVLGRRLEEAILAEVATAARAEGAELLSGCYVPSGKNAMVAGHFGKLGFAKLGEDSDGKTRWRLILADYRTPSLPMRIIAQERITGF